MAEAEVNPKPSFFLIDLSDLKNIELMAECSQGLPNDEKKLLKLNLIQMERLIRKITIMNSVLLADLLKKE